VEIMTYHDEIITITLVRGQLACSLGEQGLMVKNWSALKRALERELYRETPSRDDGHSGSCEVGDLLLKRLLEAGNREVAGIAPKPDSGPNECWPFDKPWFTGEAQR
jgi:hypothetical protein